jgi:hypothetical protein
LQKRSVHGALAGDEKENPVRIVMGQTRHRGQPFFIQGVIKAPWVNEFPEVRHRLFVNGIFLILYEAKGVGIDPHGILLCDLFQAFSLVEFQEFGEIDRGGDTSGKDAFPGFFTVFCNGSQKHLPLKDWQCSI